MTKAIQLLEFVRSQPFGSSGLSTACLIAFGMDELGLPAKIEAKDMATGKSLEGDADVGTVFGQISLPDMTKFTKTDEGWVFSNNMFDNILCYVGDWWPALVYLRLGARIKEIPETLSGQKMTLAMVEILDLAKALKWNPETVSAYGGTYGIRDHDIRYWLDHSNKHHFWGTVNRKTFVVELDSQEGHCWRPEEPNWLELIEALAKREDSLKFTLPHS